ncbi:MAG: type II toxin-antitoxin system VapC family toxin [Gammaproteobacteria bacterium]|nr:type II toxin-antitoxin system VapC family toxin [Gammaproteobacteria bacterium]
MIVVDTNIISEMMKPAPESKVVDWLNQNGATDLFITSITVAEISYGIHALPKGKRRTKLDDLFKTAINEAFKHRILDFTESAAHCYGEIMAQQKMTGHPLSVCDGQIAAIVKSHGFALATRNTKDFSTCGFEIINPFLVHC